MKRLLIVDDHPPSLRVVTAAFRDEGYEVVEAASLGETLRHLDERDPSQRLPRSPFRSRCGRREMRKAQRQGSVERDRVVSSLAETPMFLERMEFWLGTTSPVRSRPPPREGDF